MKSLMLILIMAGSSITAFAGTEVVYTSAKKRGDYGLKAKFTVHKNTAKLLLKRKATGCGFGGVCNYQSKVQINGLNYNKALETISYKGTLCGTTRTEFISYAGRMGRYIVKFTGNGNCELTVNTDRNQYQVNITH